jgi:hypothetical protein
MTTLIVASTTMNSLGYGSIIKGRQIYNAREVLTHPKYGTHVEKVVDNLKP